MGSKERQRLEPILAGARASRPPCCVSTHCSCVVDICLSPLSPTFFDHREAPPCRAPMTSVARADGPRAWWPLAYATLSLSSGSREEAPCGLAPGRLGARGVSGSVDVLSGSAPVIGCF